MGTSEPEQPPKDPPESTDEATVQASPPQGGQMGQAAPGIAAPDANAGTGGNGDDPPDGGPPALPPVMARRTYICLRLGAVGVIAMLFLSMYFEWRDGTPRHCLQNSISAFFYTPVQSVFVGALCAMGLVMIVLWGKTAWEDGWFNLAGLLAPVVAFVPTSKSNGCGIPGSNSTVADQQADAAAKAAHDAFVASQAGAHNNMLTYICAVLLALIGLAIFGAVAHARDWEFVTNNPTAYWAPLTVAVVLWIAGAYKFHTDSKWFYHHAHITSANTMFAFILLAVIDIGWQKWPRPNWNWSKNPTGWFQKRARNLFLKPIPYNEPKKQWAVGYWILAILMAGGALVIHHWAPSWSFRLGQHRTWLIESWMILGLAGFWLAQTFDRRNDGAPPRTRDEIQKAKQTANQAAA
jgi:hypothetical protein